MNNHDPVVNINDHLEVEWPINTNEKAYFHVKICKIKKCKNIQKSSYFLYSLYFIHEQVIRKTRLLHLSWRLICINMNFYEISCKIPTKLYNLDYRYILAPM